MRGTATSGHVSEFEHKFSLRTACMTCYMMPKLPSSPGNWTFPITLNAAQGQLAEAVYVRERPLDYDLFRASRTSKASGRAMRKGRSCIPVTLSSRPQNFTDFRRICGPRNSAILVSVPVDQGGDCSRCYELVNTVASSKIRAARQDSYCVTWHKRTCSGYCSLLAKTSIQIHMSLLCAACCAVTPVMNSLPC
jgi:hypothetical protein